MVGTELVGWEVGGRFVEVGRVEGGFVRTSPGLRVVVGGMGVLVGVAVLVEVEVGVYDGVIEPVDVTVGVEVCDAVRVAEGVRVRVEVGDAVTVGSRLGVSVVSSAPVMGIIASNSEASGWAERHM